MLCRIGEVEVWRVLDEVAALMPLRRFFPDLDAATLARHRGGPAGLGIRPDAQTGEDWLVLPVQAFLLRTPRRLILVDACIGDQKTVPHLPQWSGRRESRFLAALAAAGARPEEVDVVMCTHLHVDHVGWATTLENGRWRPTFPNARVLASATELAHARAQAEANPESTAAAIWRETLAPLLEAGRLETVASGAVELDEAVRLLPTPGHTPGHVSVLIDGAGSGAGAAGAAVTGDLAHTPLQCAVPALCPIVDVDKPLARATRRAFFARMAEEERLVLATHFPLPSAGLIRRDGDAFRWAPAI